MRAGNYVYIDLADEVRPRRHAAQVRHLLAEGGYTLPAKRRRVKADGFRINGDIYLKPDRLRRWIPSKRDRVVLKDSGILRTHCNDAATIEQVIAGIPGKPRYYVLDGDKRERLCERSRHVPDDPLKNAKSRFSRYANLRHKRASEKHIMKVSMSGILRFWVDVEYERIKKHVPGGTRTQLIAQILRKFDAAGDAMRFLNAQGKIVWKATPAMLSRLSDAEQETIDDMDDCV